jgi:hypothetical protein
MDRCMEEWNKVHVKRKELRRKCDLEIKAFYEQQGKVQPLPLPDWLIKELSE